MPEFDVIFALPEKLPTCPIFYDVCPKMSEVYMIIAQKICVAIFGGWRVGWRPPPLPPPRVP